ncbi:RNA polymerase sigma factor [Bacillus sp. B-jedd]|uniref:RNA polymerase sigma factor n=1 Tax=Bacillus sp. B-jedd TaxID=1476857 RepID=UPI002F42E265
MMKNFSQLMDTDNPKTWILSIARNTCMDVFRKQKLISLLPKRLSGRQQENIDSTKKAVINRENWTELQVALLKLKPAYRSVVILRALKEMSTKETAEVLGWSESKVRVDYHRALKKLKWDLKIQEGWVDDEASGIAPK